MRTQKVLETKVIDRQLMMQIAQQHPKTGIFLASLQPWFYANIISKNPSDITQLKAVISSILEDLAPKLGKVDSLLQQLFNSNSFRACSYEDARIKIAEITFKYLKKHGGEKISYPATWIYQVGRREIIHMAAQEPKIKDLHSKDDGYTPEELLDIALNNQQEAVEPYLSIEAQDLMEKVSSFLTETELELLFLYLQEIPYEKIAKKLAIQVGTARVRVNRIKQKLTLAYAA